MPSQLSHSLLAEEPSNGSTPAAEDDIEAVKTLCSMGFSRTQAVTALEQHGYDVQRALNSLLGELFYSGTYRTSPLPSPPSGTR
jgi:epidermal growth factor receptor substrate 15